MARNEHHCTKKTDHSEEHGRKQLACSVEVKETFAGRKSQAV